MSERKWLKILEFNFCLDLESIICIHIYLLTLFVTLFRIAREKLMRIEGRGGLSRVLAKYLLRLERDSEHLNIMY